MDSKLDDDGQPHESQQAQVDRSKGPNLRLGPRRRGTAYRRAVPSHSAVAWARLVAPSFE